MPTAPIGLIANPAAGKDIRRLVARASVFDNAEKRRILQRVVLGALATGAGEFLYMPDAHALVAGAAADLPAEARLRPVDVPYTASALDTARAAAAMRAAGCAVVVTLGGDGTNRAVARGWLDAPLVAVSTGTNNVFPSMVEGTVAGAAAGLIAGGTLPLREVATRSKRVHITIEGEADDLALVDAALVEGTFVGSRALWEPERLRLVVLTRADPAAIGLSALGGLLEPLDADEDAGLALTLGPHGAVVRAPLAPGLYRDVAVAAVRRLALAEPLTVTGPGVLALDGERERLLRPGQRAVLRVLRDGPWLVDVRQTLRAAAHRRSPSPPSPLARLREGGA